MSLLRKPNLVPLLIALTGLLAIGLLILYAEPQSDAVKKSVAHDVAQANLDTRLLQLSGDEFQRELIANYTAEEYQSQLIAAQQTLQAQLNEVDLVERIALQLESDLVAIKLEHYLQHYKNKNQLLYQLYQSLPRFSSVLSSRQLQLARIALLSGDFVPAYQAFGQAERQFSNAKQKEQINLAALASYQRGRIAKEQQQYRKAYWHFRRAVQFNPKELRYLMDAGELADSIALYGNAINYYQAALHVKKQDNQVNSSQLRPLWLKLGKALTSQGETTKGVDYLQRALRSAVEEFGGADLRVAHIRSDLAWAFESARDYQRAVDYYRQALDVYLLQLGKEDAETRELSENLRATKRLMAVKK